MDTVRNPALSIAQGSAPHFWVPEPTERHAAVLDKLLALPGIYGNLVPGAHLAALAIEHGLTMCSTDSDFARFPDLTWLNPLARERDPLKRAARRLSFGGPVPGPAPAQPCGLVFRPREHVGPVGLAQAECRSAPENSASASR